MRIKSSDNKEIIFKNWQCSDLLKNVKENSDTVNIPFEYKVIKSLIEYIDNGIEIPNNNLIKVLNCADYLLVDSISCLKNKLILSFN